MLSLLLPLAAFAQEISYEGSNSGTAANYVKGKPVTVSHSGGNIAVRCMETEKLSARVQYTVYGTAEGPLQSYGNGIGLAVWGDTTGGGVKTRMPSKPSGVSSSQVDVTINVPKGVSSLTVSQTGSGWVQVLDCSGTMKVSAGAGGAYVSGTITGGAIKASGGDVKVDVAQDGLLKGATAISAPGGNLTVILPSAQGGKLTAQGEEVSIQQTVMGGTNTPTLVTGDLGVSGPALAFSAKGRVEVTQH